MIHQENLKNKQVILILIILGCIIFLLVGLGNPKRKNHFNLFRTLDTFAENNKW